MSDNNMNKGIIAAFIAVFSYVYNAFGILFAILVMMMTIDYITGLLAAIMHKKASSRVGIIGIIKKVCYITLVVMAVLFDFALLHGVSRVGASMPVNNIFGTAVMCWLISNEMLSIIENLNGANVPAPAFLIAAVKKFKKSTETNVESKTNE